MQFLNFLVAAYFVFAAGSESDWIVVILLVPTLTVLALYLAERRRDEILKKKRESSSGVCSLQSTPPKPPPSCMKLSPSLSASTQKLSIRARIQDEERAIEQLEEEIIAKEASYQQVMQQVEKEREIRLKVAAHHEKRKQKGAKSLLCPQCGAHTAAIAAAAGPISPENCNHHHHHHHQKANQAATDKEIEQPAKKDPTSSSSSTTTESLPPPSRPRATLLSKLAEASSKSIPANSGPPPPPLPGALRSKQPTIMAKKPVYWKKLSVGKLDRTIFAPILLQESYNWAEVIEAHAKELEEHFFEDKEKKQREMEEKKKKMKQTSSSQKILLLNLTRANNIAISLSRFKGGANQIFASIKEMKIASLCAENGDDFLTADILRTLLSLLPTPEEVKTLTTANIRDRSLLGISEQFQLSSLDIFCCEGRLRSFLYMAELADRISEIKNYLELWNSAISQVMQSDALCELLELSLLVGNFINSGHSMLSNALGFSIDSALLFCDIKSADKKSTLMHFLAALARAKNSKAVKAFSQCDLVSKALRYPFEAISAEAGAVLEGWESFEETLRKLRPLAYPQNSNIGDESAKIFVDRMTDLASSKAKYIDEVNEKLSSVRDQLSSLSVFLGESESISDAKASELLLHIHQFLSAFKSATEEIIEWESDEQNVKIDPLFILPSPSSKMEKSHHHHKRKKEKKTEGKKIVE